MGKLGLQVFIVNLTISLAAAHLNQSHHELVLGQNDWLVLWADGTLPDLGPLVRLQIRVDVKTLVVVAPLALDWGLHLHHGNLAG